MKKLSIITLALLLLVTGGLFAGGSSETNVETIVFGDVSWTQSKCITGLWPSL